MTTCRRWTTTTCAAASRAPIRRSTRRPRSWPATPCRCRAFEILGEHDTHSDPQARCELVVALGAAAGARGMAGGQMIDMVAEGQVLDAPAVTRLQALKTGRFDTIQRGSRGYPWPGHVTATPLAGGLWT